MKNRCSSLLFCLYICAMQFLYNILVYLVDLLLPVLGFFNKKIRLFYRGRKDITAQLQHHIQNDDAVIWMHCASLGEFEQGRPVLEALRKDYPDYKLVLSFFSPSGYEVRKSYSGADLVLYLPLDTPYKVRRFLDLLHPGLAIFVKYEFWPNVLKALEKRKIPTLLISGIFRENQAFFRKSGAWLRRSLNAFSWFFVQNETSKSLLESLHFNHVSVAGDTRFGRVQKIVLQRQDIGLLEVFVQNARHTLVAGSTWPEDMEIWLDYINEHAREGEKFVIAPHNIHKQEIDTLRRKIRKKTLLYSQADKASMREAQVCIIDSIGILSSVYAYADIAYVGGGFGAGIHNILEPAAYQIPVIIGPNNQKFQEARDLIKKGGCFEITTSDALSRLLHQMYHKPGFLRQSGEASGKYIAENTGATAKIMHNIEQRFLKKPKPRKSV